MSETNDPGIRVTVTDLKTGETQTTVIMDEYVIVCAGSCHIAAHQVYKNGTVQLTIKGRRGAAAGTE